MPDVRVGTGFDVHAFEAGRPLRLGGVDVPHEQGLAGHSDADVLTHAIMDALLGASALGDLGTHFPPGDPAYKDARSLDLLGTVLEMVRGRGWDVGNVDATLIAQEPRLASFVPQMRQALALAMGIPESDVAVKAKTTDHLGTIGRGEGIAAQAIALLTRVRDDRPRH